LHEAGATASNVTPDGLELCGEGGKLLDAYADPACFSAPIRLTMRSRAGEPRHGQQLGDPFAGNAKTALAIRTRAR
jgi:hypothetical protein